MEGLPNGRMIPAAEPGALSWRSLLFQLALVGLILGLPILGTSYILVGKVSSDIATATTEARTLTAFEPVARLFPLLETLHRAVTSGTPAQRLAAVARLDRATASVRGSASWTRWRAVWSRVRRAPDAAGLDRLLLGLCDVATDIENASPIDYDPSDAIQLLAALEFREDPRSLAILRQTGDAAVAAGGSKIGLRAVEAIATGEALQLQPISLATTYTRSVERLEPTLASALAPFAASATTETAGFQKHIRSTLATATLDRRQAATIEASARTALDARERLWRLNRQEAARLVARRREQLLLQRRIMIAYSCIAVLIGALGIVSAGRYIVRRGRIETASAELERDKLRAELAQISMERALRLQEAQFRTVFDNTDLGIVVFDEAGSIVEYNAAVAEILGASTKAVLEEQREAVARFSIPACEPFTFERKYECADGEVKWLVLTYSGEYVDGACQMVVLLIRDATRERALQARLAFEASHDSLTGIANRAAFESALQRQVEVTNEPFALMYLDLDKFKPINDTYGHAAGDHVLATSAGRLVAALASDDLCARIGGDEFAVLLRGANDRTLLRTIAERILASIAAPIVFGHLLLEVTASIGFAIAPETRDSASEIKHEADEALYAVKKCGRNNYHIYETSVLVQTLD